MPGRMHTVAATLLVLFITCIYEVIVFFVPPDEATRNMAMGVFMDIYYCLWTAAPLMVIGKVCFPPVMRLANATDSQGFAKFSILLK